TDPERQIALYQDEGDVRKQAGDFAGAATALRSARKIEGGADASLKQQLATVVLEQVQAGKTLRRAISPKPPRCASNSAKLIPAITASATRCARSKSTPRTTAPCSSRFTTASRRIARSRRPGAPRPTSKPIQAAPWPPKRASWCRRRPKRGA